MSTTADLSTMTAEELAAEIERVEDEMHARQHEITVLRGRKIVVEAYLMKALGDGEVVAAPSGRYVFKDEGALGAATVNNTAIDEGFYSLPKELAPRYERVYPSVGAIRKAAKEGRLPEGTTAETFLTPAPRGSVLRWRSIKEDHDD